jgi:Trypsin-co-occurring domain 1
MTELIRVPLGDGEYLVAEVDKLDIPGDEVVLAAPEPGRAAAQLTGKLEAGLRAIRPAVAELVEALKGSGPETISVEFGVKIGGETGVILAKGTADVNFKVALEWKRASGDPPTAGS